MSIELHPWYIPGVAIVEGKKPGPEPTVVGPLKRMLPRHADDIDVVLRTIQLDFFTSRLAQNVTQFKSFVVIFKPKLKTKIFSVELVP